MGRRSPFAVERDHDQFPPAATRRGRTTSALRAQSRWPEFWLDNRLLQMLKLSSEHVEPSRRLPADRCMVRRFSSRELGPSCDAPRSS